MEFAALRGKLALVGAPAPDKVLQLNHVKVIQSGICVVGSIEGDAVPSEVSLSIRLSGLWEKWLSCGEV